MCVTVEQKLYFLKRKLSYNYSIALWGVSFYVTQVFVKRYQY